MSEISDPRITPESKRNAHIHYVIAFCGGFLGIFPIVNVIELFGSAQTSNLIEVVHSILGHDWIALAHHLIGAFLYALTAFLVTFLAHHTKIKIKILALLVDFASALVMWKMPEGLPEIFYLYPTFFAMSFQWCSFSGSYGYTCSTIFSTNNLRQLTSSLTEWLCNGKPAFKLKAKFFGATMICFHLGVAAAFVTWEKLGNACFLLVVLPLLLAGILILSPVKTNDSSKIENN